MAKKINVSILQMSSVLGDVDANIQKVDSLVDKYLPEDSDVLILPEVWTVGWDCSRFINSAQELGSGSVYYFLSSLAKKYTINVIGGSYIIKNGENYYNTCPVFDRSGKLIDSYSKMHLYSYYGCDEGKYISHGDKPVMVCLDGVNFGLSICYDIRFPEIYRAYAIAGADVLVNCAAWGAKKLLPWNVMTKSRAIENQCYMVALTQCGHIKDDEYNLGLSSVIDYLGNELCSISGVEGIVSAQLDIDKMHDTRLKSPTIGDIRNNYEVNILCKK